MKQLLIILILLPFIATSQMNSSIDILLGGAYSYRNLSTASDNESGNLIIKTRKAETPKLNGRLGFNYNRQLAPRFYLKTGIRLASIGYAYEKRTGIIWGSELPLALGGTGMIDPTLPHEIQLIKDYWFIEIPIMGRYEFSGSKIKPFIEMGVSPSFYVTTRTRQLTDIGKEPSHFDKTQNESFNKIQIVGNMSFGVNYQVKEKMQLFIQPIFRYHLTKLVEAPIKEYLYNFGIELGLRRALK